MLGIPPRCLRSPHLIFWASIYYSLSAALNSSAIASNKINFEHSSQRHTETSISPLQFPMTSRARFWAQKIKNLARDVIEKCKNFSQEIVLCKVEFKRTLLARLESWLDRVIETKTYTRLQASGMASKCVLIESESQFLINQTSTSISRVYWAECQRDVLQSS